MDLPVRARPRLRTLDEVQPLDRAAHQTRDEPEPGGLGAQVEQATDRVPDRDEIAAMSAYEMAATVDFGLEAKQGLLDLRSEAARLRALDEVQPLDRPAHQPRDEPQARARSNGKVNFG